MGTHRAHHTSMSASHQPCFMALGYGSYPSIKSPWRHLVSFSKGLVMKHGDECWVPGGTYCTPSAPTGLDLQLQSLKALMNHTCGVHPHGLLFITERQCWFFSRSPFPAMVQQQNRVTHLIFLSLLGVGQH